MSNTYTKSGLYRVFSYFHDLEKPAIQIEIERLLAKGVLEVSSYTDTYNIYSVIDNPSDSCEQPEYQEVLSKQEIRKQFFKDYKISDEQNLCLVIERKISAHELAVVEDGDTNKYVFLYDRDKKIDPIKSRNAYIKLLISVVKNDAHFLTSDEEQEEYEELVPEYKDKIDAFCMRSLGRILMDTRYCAKSMVSERIKKIEKIDLLNKNNDYISALERLAFLEINMKDFRDDIMECKFFIFNELTGLDSDERQIIRELLDIQEKRFQLSGEELVKRREEYLSQTRKTICNEYRRKPNNSTINSEISIDEMKKETKKINREVFFMDVLAVVDDLLNMF